MNKVGYSFKDAYQQLREKDKPIVKGLIMEVLQVTTSMSWSRWMRGLCVPNIKEYQSIVEIFNKYGIPKRKVWEEIILEEE